MSRRGVLPRRSRRVLSARGRGITMLGGHGLYGGRSARRTVLHHDPRPELRDSTGLLFCGLPRLDGLSVGRLLPPRASKHDASWQPVIGVCLRTCTLPAGAPFGPCAGSGGTLTCYSANVYLSAIGTPNTEGVCLPACMTTADCPNGSGCLATAHACVPRCVAGNEVCPSALICDPARMLCVDHL